MRRKLLLAIGLALLVIAVSTVGCGGFTAPSPPKAEAWSALFSQQNTGIWVSGEGKVSVVPDVAILSLGVEAQDITVAAAQSQASTAMTAVVAELDNYGVAKKDIKTQHFSIYPVRRWAEERGEEILIGYRVTNTVTAKVRKVEDTGAIIDAVAKAGGDYIRINSISFTVDDPSIYHEEARQKAMADAEAKAKQLAELSGVKLGRPTYINESGGLIPPPPIPYRAEVEMAPVPAPAPPPPISPGETEVRLTVQVVYSIQ
ncbi:MAG: SIMPL domain-containing protein [Dehalococcoidales bacterium]